MNTVATPVAAPDWASELQEIATRADALASNPDAPLADRLDIATAAFSRLWLAWSPQVIARSCRASARLLEPVLVVCADLDQQLQQNSEIRMKALLSAGQLERPAVIEPVLPIAELEPEADPDPLPIARAMAPREQEVAPEPIADLLEDNPLAPADLSHLSDEEFMGLSPVGFHGPEAPEPAPVASAPASVEPAPPAPPAPEAPEAPPATYTSGWLSLQETAELLGIAATTLSRWRFDNRLGREGVDWEARGRSFAFCPERIEVEMVRLAAAREQRPKAPRRRPRVDDRRPAGWLTADEIAVRVNCTGSRIRRILAAGDIPAEMVHRVGYKSRWIDPAAVELLT